MVNPAKKADKESVAVIDVPNDARVARVASIREKMGKTKTITQDFNRIAAEAQKGNYCRELFDVLKEVYPDADPFENVMLSHQHEVVAIGTLIWNGDTTLLLRLFPAAIRDRIEDANHEANLDVNERGFAKQNVPMSTTFNKILVEHANQMYFTSIGVTEFTEQEGGTTIRTTNYHETAPEAESRKKKAAGRDEYFNNQRKKKNPAKAGQNMYDGDDMGDE